MIALPAPLGHNATMAVPSNPDLHRFRRDSALGPADAEAIARAAEILRDRTMSLEPDPKPARRLAIALIVATVAIAVALVVYRAPVRALLGW